MKINSHLRDQHGYSLAESVKWAPLEMERIHDDEHAEGGCNHTHEQGGGERMFDRMPSTHRCAGQRVNAPGTGHQEQA